MRKISLVILCFLSVQIYSQSQKRDTLYLLIDKKDSLICRQVATNKYSICYDKKKLVKKNRTPLAKGAVWVADAKYDYYTSEQICLYFVFYPNKRQIISKSALEKLKILGRKDFLNYKLDDTHFTYYFIEPTNNIGEFIIQEFLLVIFE